MLHSSWSKAEELTRICITGVPVSVVHCHRHLGVTVTSDLNFQHHFSAIYKAFKQRVNLLVYMGKHLSPPAIISLYKGYVRPTIEYASPIWCFSITKAQLQSLDVLQARVVRRFLSRKNIPFNRDDHKSDLNAAAFLESLQYRRQFMHLIILFKYIHFHPQYLAMFHITLSHSPRRPNKLNFNAHGRHLSTLFLYQTGRLWNCLPPSITELTTLADFRPALTKYYKRYAFDTTGVPYPT